jgi:hypothetical protein
MADVRIVPLRQLTTYHARKGAVAINAALIPSPFQGVGGKCMGQARQARSSGCAPADYGAFPGGMEPNLNLDLAREAYSSHHHNCGNDNAGLE